MHAHSTNRSPANTPKTVPAPAPRRVCGSLDPPARSKKASDSGWRYIQLTDTLDELRMLLPPRPAAIYANLLKVESHALAKNDPESLREIQYIRHLKDAMIKRCQTMAQETIRAVSTTHDTRSISVVEAPLDFKLRRLEQWWEKMEPQVKVKSRSKRQAYAERQSRIQASTSTSTVSPNKTRVHAGAVTQTNLTQGVGAAQSQHAVGSQSSPVAHKKRPTPLTVPLAGQTISAQSSPLMPLAPQSPNTSVRRGSVQITSSQSPQMPSSHDQSTRPRLRQATVYRPMYANSQMASPLESPYNPSFDPNQSLAIYQYHSTPAASHSGMPVEAHSPSVALRNEMTNDSRMNNHVYSSADALSEPAPAQADTSRLINRFHATYMTSPSNSASSPSSNGSKPPAYIQQNFAHSRENLDAQLQAGPGHVNHTRAHGSLSLPLPSTTHSHSSDKDHRRRATVDGDDMDRSVPRPKGYMYRTSAVYGKEYDVSPEVHYAEHAYGAQGLGARLPDGDDSPSAVRRMARALNQSLVPGGSPRGSTSSQGSSRLRGSPGQAYSHSNGAVNDRSPNLLPPDQGLSRSRRGSNESDINANRMVVGVQGDNKNIIPTRQLRRTVSRRSLHDGNPNGTEQAGVNPQPVVPPADYYAPQGRSPRRSTVSPPDVQHQVEADSYRRGRTRRGERSPRRRHTYDASPRHEGAVIPDMAILTPITSNRNSRYTSGGSSVSEPVIPDVSLIVEAALSRNKADRVRRRLVPLQSSSEEGGGSRHVSDFEYSDSSSDDDDVDHEDEYYRRPYRTRDGYGSGYASEADGGKSRAPSRIPSRSPSRGILKRSSSACSQRSSKSVRLEIPRDRRALEEVRDAEEKVDRAEKQLDELQRRKGNRTKNADPDMQSAAEALDQAKRSLKEKEDEYTAILEALKLKRSEQDETRPRYV